MSAAALVIDFIFFNRMLCTLYSLLVWSVILYFMFCFYIFCCSVSWWTFFQIVQITCSKIHQDFERDKCCISALWKPGDVISFVVWNLIVIIHFSYSQKINYKHQLLINLRYISAILVLVHFVVCMSLTFFA